MPTNFIRPLVIFAYGNPSRGDDALGPALLYRLEQEGNFGESIEFIEDFQLQIEHALDLENHELALFIDASVACTSPFTFTRLIPVRDDTFTSHALHPTSVLYTYQQIKKRPPPPAFLLSIRGEQFELGDPLSSSARNNLEEAVSFLKPLCYSMEISHWQQFVTKTEPK